MSKSVINRKTSDSVEEPREFPKLLDRDELPEIDNLILHRMNSLEIQAGWNLICNALADSLPEKLQNVSNITNAMGAIRSHIWQAWAIQTRDKSTGYLRFCGLCITRVLEDDIIKLRSLDIVHLMAYEHVSLDAWGQGMQYLYDFADSEGCHRIIAGTERERVMEILESLGFAFRAQAYKEL